MKQTGSQKTCNLCLFVTLLICTQISNSLLNHKLVDPSHEFNKVNHTLHIRNKTVNCKCEHKREAKEIKECVHVIIMDRGLLQSCTQKKWWWFKKLWKPFPGWQSLNRQSDVSLIWSFLWFFIQPLGPLLKTDHIVTPSLLLGWHDNYQLQQPTSAERPILVRWLIFQCFFREMKLKRQRHRKTERQRAIQKAKKLAFIWLPSYYGTETLSGCGWLS